MKISEIIRLEITNAELTKTKQGNVVKAASIHPVVHEMRHKLHDLFTNHGYLDEINLTPTDIKSGWFKKKSPG